MISTTLETARRGGLSETRRALKDLRAQPPLEDLGLELALRQLIDSVAERAGFKTNVNVDSPLPYLAPNVEQVFLPHRAGNTRECLASCQRLHGFGRIARRGW